MSVGSRRKIGWHANGEAPRRGKGASTVEPIRSKKAIFAIRQHLAERPRDLALFVCGIHFGLRGKDLTRLRWKEVLTASGDLKKVIELCESKTGKVRRI